MNTRSALTIVWSFRTAEDVLRTEPNAPGVIFYGYWPGQPVPELDEGTFRQIWTSGKFECRSRQWLEYGSVSMEVHIIEWPESLDWPQVLLSVFKLFESIGAVVSWCGNELSCPSVSILNPESATGNVYAAYSARTGLVGGSGLDEEYEELHDAELQSVWEQTGEAHDGREIPGGKGGKGTDTF